MAAFILSGDPFLYRDLRSQRKGTDIRQDHFFDRLVSLLHGRLHRSAQGHGLIRVDMGIRHPPEKPPDKLTDNGKLGRSSHQNHLVYLGQPDSRIRQAPFHRPADFFKQRLAGLLIFRYPEGFLHLLPIQYTAHHRNPVFRKAQLALLRLFLYIQTFFQAEFLFLDPAAFQEHFI